MEGARFKFKTWQLLAAAGLICGLAIIWFATRPAATQYVTAAVSQGDIVRAIVTTGTLNPVTTVQVGSYVSGIIQKLSCDFNTKVKAGQLCAKIDPRPYQVVYDQATANLSSAAAQLNKDQASLVYAKLNYSRDANLQKKGIVSQDALDLDKSALDQAIAQVAVDQATIKERQAALAAAKVNLDYTDIISPVDGVVISRSIDVGQTVAASFQTPTLFLIAKDLTQMQVDTNVSETDVAGAKVGQKALFNVEAYPDQAFEGKVKQVRQAPISVQNVVTYDVVIGVNNPDFKLLPGMTANMKIISEQHSNVLRVPIQALRFTPGKIPSKTKDHHVYILINNKPKRVAVKVGINDGTLSEISGDDIKAGDQVIVNQIKASENKDAPKRSPLRL